MGIVKVAGGFALADVLIKVAAAGVAVLVAVKAVRALRDSEH